MSAELNHTIVWCRDNERSAQFLADMLGRPPPKRFHHFMVVELDNGVSLDFMTREGAIARQHYAFLVDDAGFDRGMQRIADLGLRYWADPARQREREINHNDGGRGVYFEDPDGHFLEMITTQYGVPKR
ncbi:MAG: VOC family protein [Novosphingobium sp.]|nr:VOC family protein [Novosphingobium sp.]